MNSLPTSTESVQYNTVRMYLQSLISLLASARSVMGVQFLLARE